MKTPKKEEVIFFDPARIERSVHEEILQRHKEIAFRRGFSHGFLTGRDLKNGLKEQDILKWRYNPDKSKLPPPGSGWEQN